MISLSLRQYIFRRDRFTCQLCGAQSPHVRIEVDHKTPVSRGGNDSESNLWTACYDCNRGKGARWNDGLIESVELAWPVIIPPRCCDTEMQFQASHGWYDPTEIQPQECWWKCTKCKWTTVTGNEKQVYEVQLANGEQQRYEPQQNSL